MSALPAIGVAIALCVAPDGVRAAPPPSTRELHAAVTTWQDCLEAAPRRLNDRRTDAAIVGLAVTRMCHREYLATVETFTRDFYDQQRTVFLQGPIRPGAARGRGRSLALADDTAAAIGHL